MNPIPQFPKAEHWTVARFLEPGGIVPVDVETTAELVRHLAWLADENDRLREGLKLARADMLTAIEEIDRELMFVPSKGVSV